MLKDSLPELYSHILPEEVLRLAPNETKATCSACFKATKQAPAPHYDARLKCCTFYPFIPNYLVGAILESAAPGATAVREILRERRFALPIGLCAPPGYQKKFNERREHGFGRDAELLCPFYEFKTGHCGVWRQRGHECATFFCVSNYGANGEKFWGEMRDLLHYVEMHISQEAMVHKGYDLNEIAENLEFIRRPLDDKDPRHSLDALDWSRFWAHHFDNIEGYYLACCEFARENSSRLKRQIAADKFAGDGVDVGTLRKWLTSRA